MQRLIHPAAASRNGAYFQGRSGKKPEGFPAGAIRPCESTGKAFWNAGGAWIC